MAIVNIQIKEGAATPEQLSWLSSQVGKSIKAGRTVRPAILVSRGRQSAQTTDGTETED